MPTKRKQTLNAKLIVLFTVIYSQVRVKYRSLGFILIFWILILSGRNHYPFNLRIVLIFILSIAYMCACTYICTFSMLCAIYVYSNISLHILYCIRYIVQSIYVCIYICSVCVCVCIETDIMFSRELCISRLFLSCYIGK